jgi:hypothetical protein
MKLVPLREQLTANLLKRAALWSYEPNSEISDEVLIEAALSRGEVEDIQLLFKLFPITLIESVWHKELLPDERKYRHNYYLAAIFFEVPNPKQYIQPYITHESRRSRLQQLTA